MIKQVWIKDLRNLEETTLSLGSYKHCYIFGNNNQGKTSLLEAIYIAAKHESPIQEKVEKAVQYNKDHCIIGLDFAAESPYRIYAKCDHTGKKDIVLNQKKDHKKNTKKRLIDYISADILHLFQKDPQYRRRHLDRFCSLLFTGYEDTLRQYEKALKQKNRHLKQDPPRRELIDVFNKQLVPLAVSIIKTRLNALYYLNKHLSTEVVPLEELEGKKIYLGYKWTRLTGGTPDQYATILEKQLKEDSEKECILGHSLSGPHRDDFVVTVDDKSLTDHYSRGINRSVAILIQKAQMQLLAKDSQPITFLLDDTFAEVDTANTRRLIQELCQVGQVFYVSVQEKNYDLFSDTILYSIDKGVLQRERMS